MVRIDTERARTFLKSSSFDALHEQAAQAHETLLDGSGAGNDFLGWRRILLDPNDALIEDIEGTAARIREEADVFLCIGIGGSYLGAKAVIQALTSYFGTAPSESDAPEVLFAGHHMSGAYVRDLLEYLEGKSVYVNVISKSGTTLEPALTFRLVRQWMDERFDDADDRIVVTTDPSKGALNQLREQRHFKKYEIPRDVGGRFSVLTPVGLLPIAVAGIDIRSFFYGAVSACERLQNAETNPALEYAALRYGLLQDGYSVEALATFEPRLGGIGSWWQQLFGESEGKQEKGLYPSAVQYSTDLHSLGQYMQQGQRILIETFLIAERDQGDLQVPELETNLDKLGYLEGETFTHINRRAYEGTIQAHHDGGVPTMTVWIDAIKPPAIGELLYLFEHAVAVGGYLLGVNPFDQPGVEDYKREMFRLLGAP